MWKRMKVRRLGHDEAYFGASKCSSSHFIFRRKCVPFWVIRSHPSLRLFSLLCWIFTINNTPLVCLFVWRDRQGKGSLCYTTLVIYYLPARQCSVKLTLFCNLWQLISEPLQHFVCSFFAFLKETDRAQKWIELGHIREVANFWLSSHNFGEVLSCNSNIQFNISKIKEFLCMDEATPYKNLFNSSVQTINHNMGALKELSCRM